MEHPHIEQLALSASIHVEHLVRFGRKHLSLPYVDTFWARNRLLDCLGLTERHVAVDDCSPDLDVILQPILDYAEAKGLCTDEGRVRFGVRLVDMVMPSPNTVAEKFETIALNEGVRAATDWFYNLSIQSGYIPMKAISENPRWKTTGAHGDIHVTINTAKPEKDPKEVAAAKAMPQTSYPKCMLCPDNMGYPGRPGYPARQTLRFLPLPTEEGDMWYMQYSPYSYFIHHCIFFSESHHPMNLGEASYRRMLEMVRSFPYYFVGSNAPLPIVGGSILAHDHYQGGGKVHPMFTRYASRRYVLPAFPLVKVCTVDWYNSVIRLRCRDRDQLAKVVNYVANVWNVYSDPSQNIISRTGDTPHNCITPIFRMERGEYYAELILRNNRTDEKHPYGIFHPTEDMHHIKKEAIGIIEVMGTFILPGRLAGELDALADILCGAKPFVEKELADPANPLEKHKEMLVSLLADAGFANSKEEAVERVRAYVSATCEKILGCTAVFKDTEEGQAAFDRFMRSFGCVEYVYRENLEADETDSEGKDSKGAKRGRSKKTTEAPVASAEVAPQPTPEQSAPTAEPTKPETPAEANAKAPAEAPSAPQPKRRGRPRKNPIE